MFVAIVGVAQAMYTLVNQTLERELDQLVMHERVV